VFLTLTGHGAAEALEEESDALEREPAA
jgi:hypothetical protein